LLIDCTRTASRTVNRKVREMYGTDLLAQNAHACSLQTGTYVDRTFPFVWREASFPSQGQNDSPEAEGLGQEEKEKVVEG